MVLLFRPRSAKSALRHGKLQGSLLKTNSNYEIGCGFTHLGDRSKHGLRRLSASAITRAALQGFGSNRPVCRLCGHGSSFFDLSGAIVRPLRTQDIGNHADCLCGQLRICAASSESDSCQSPWPAFKRLKNRRRASCSPSRVPAALMSSRIDKRSAARCDSRDQACRKHTVRAQRPRPVPRTDRPLRGRPRRFRVPPGSDRALEDRYATPSWTRDDARGDEAMGER